MGTVRFLVDAAILAIVTNAAYCLTAHNVLLKRVEIAGTSPAQMSNKCVVGPTAILLAVKALYGGGHWLRKYPLLFLSIPLLSFVGAILEIGLLEYVLPDSSAAGHTVGFFVGLMMSYVLPQPLQT